MSPSGNGRKSLAFRRSLEVDHPLLHQLKLGGLGQKSEQGPVTKILEPCEVRKGRSSL